MSLEAILTDDNFMQLDAQLDHTPNCEEYNSKYNTNISEDEFQNYLRTNWAWKVVAQVPAVHWENEDNRRRAVRSVYEKYYVEKREKITKHHFTKEKLSWLLKWWFGNSACKAFITHCSDKEDVKNKIWKVVSNVSKGYWFDEEKRIKAIRSVYEKYYIKKRKKITIKQFSDEGLQGLLTQYYNHSPLAALQEAYPNDKTIQETPWKILQMLPVRYWQEKENRIRAVRSVYEKYYIKKRKKITQQHFKENGLGGLLTYWYKQENNNGVQGLIDEYESFFIKTVEENNLEEEIKIRCKCTVDNLETADIKLPLLALLQKYTPKSNEVRRNVQGKGIVYKNQRIIKVEYAYNDEWAEYESRVNPNQFLNALLWGGIKKLSEEDKEKFMNEKVLGIKVGRILLDELKHSTTGIESILINRLVNKEFADLMPKISIGSGDGNDLLEGDIGIDLNPSSEKVIQANALHYDYSKHEGINTISFPYSLHSMPRKELLPKLKGFDNFIITLPYNGQRREDLIQEIVDNVGNKAEEALTMRIKYTYQDESTKEKPVNAAILTPIKEKASEKVKEKIISRIPTLSQLNQTHPEEAKKIINALQETYFNNNFQYDKGTLTTWKWAKNKIRELCKLKKKKD